MEFMKDAIQLCLERDAKRCRHCGTTVDVHQLVKREDWYGIEIEEKVITDLHLGGIDEKQ